ncbi:MAG: hypothetical protein ABIK07_19145, partial [Planctomycetota bacterium]
DRVDQRSDLFSLGAVLYAMCTGRSPFRASNLVAVVRRVCDDTPRPIQDVNEEIPDWLIEIIDCLLEKRPADRFQTASEVAELLGTHLAIVQQPAAVPKTDGRTSRPHRQAAAPPRVAPETDSSKATTSVVLKRGSTPAGFIATLVLIIFFGVVIAFQSISPSTPESNMIYDVMTYDTMNRVLKFSLTLVFILALSSVIYWNKADQKPLPFLTWFLSILSSFLILWLSFLTTAVIRAAPPGTEFQLMHGFIMAASVLGALAVTGFAIRGQWLNLLKQGPDYIEAVKQNDARTLTGIGIVFWVLLVLWNLAIATGLYQPAFLSTGEWHLVPILIFTVLGGGFVTAGFLVERSFRKGYTARHPELAGTFADSVRKTDSQNAGRFARGRLVDRIAAWAGGMMLLIPLFLWLIGTATGGHFTPSVSEMVIVSLLFFSPVGLLVFICGAQNLVEPDSTAEKLMEGLFLLACFLLGPLGILLYIVRYLKRRDAQLAEKKEKPPVTPGEDSFAQEYRRSNKRVILGVVIGVVMLLSLILFVQNWRHLGMTEQYRALNWGVKLIVVCGMFGAAYYMKRKGDSAAMNHPWNMMCWVTAVLAGLFTLTMLMQVVSDPGSDWVVVTFDKQYPVTHISTKPGEEIDVVSQPVVIKLLPGEHALQITYKASGETFSFTRDVKKIAGKKEKIDLAPEIKRLVNHPNNKKQESAINQEQEPADWKKNRGAILISGQESSLRAGVFMDDPFQFQGESGPFGFANRFFSLEASTHEVPAGKYIIRVSSELAGWEGEYNTPQYELAEIEVKPGAIVPVTIRRDYEKLAESHPKWSQGGLFKFHWPIHKRGAANLFTVFTLTVEQALVVQELLKAFAADHPEVPEAALLKAVDADLKEGQSKTLKALFNDGQNPAWNSLIVPGKVSDTWRLVEPKSIQ